MWISLLPQRNTGTATPGRTAGVVTAVRPGYRPSASEARGQQAEPPRGRQYWPSQAAPVAVAAAEVVRAAARRVRPPVASKPKPRPPAFRIVEVEVVERLVEPPPNMRPGFVCEVVADAKLPPRLWP